MKNKLLNKNKWSSYNYSSNKEIPEERIRKEILFDNLNKLNNRNLFKLLDVGIGGGHITLMLLKLFKDIICLDYNEKNIKELLKKIKEEDITKIKLIKSKIEETNFKSKEFDIIILCGVLEHLENPKETLKNLYTNLNRNGRIHIIVPLANSLHRQLGVKMGIIKKTTELSESDFKLGHYRVYTPKLLKSHINLNKFKILNETYFYLKPFPTSIMNKLPYKIHNALNLLGKDYPEIASYIYLEIKKK